MKISLCSSTNFKDRIVFVQHCFGHANELEEVFYVSELRMVVVDQLIDESRLESIGISNVTGKSEIETLRLRGHPAEDLGVEPGNENPCPLVKVLGKIIAGGFRD